MSEAEASTKGSFRRALRHRDFRLLLGGAAVSGTGDWLYSTALIVYVFEATGSAGWVAAASIARLVPYAAFSTLGGVLADRFDRRRVMVVSDVARLVLMAAAAVVATSASQSAVAAVIFLAFLSAVAASAFMPAFMAYLPTVVDEDDLAGANALNSVVENLTLAAGPAIGGVLLLLGSVSTAFAINAVTFLVSVVCVLLIRTPGTEGQVEVEGGLLARIKEGVQGMTSSADVLLLTLLTVAFLVAFGHEIVLFAPVSEELLHTTADGASWLFAAPGIGGLFAAGLAGRLAARKHTASILVAFTVLSGAPLAAMSVVRSPWVAYVLLLVEGVAVIVADVVAITTLQRVVPKQTLGAVFGILSTLAVAAIFIGSVLAPLWIGWFGLPVACLIGGAIPIAISLIAAPKGRRMDRVGAARAASIQRRVDLLRPVPMFAPLPVAGLEQLAEAAVETDVAAATDVVREGDPADDLYLVVSGALVVRSRGEGGGEAREVNRLAAGDVFGEIGVLQRIPRTATVTASEPCTLLRIGGEDFLDAVTGVPAAAGVLRALSTARLARTHPVLSGADAGSA